MESLCLPPPAQAWLDLARQDVADTSLTLGSMKTQDTLL